MSPKGPPPTEPSSVISLAPRLPPPLLEPPEFLTPEERVIWEGAVTGMRRDSEPSTSAAISSPTAV